MVVGTANAVSGKQQAKQQQAAQSQAANAQAADMARQAEVDAAVQNALAAQAAQQATAAAAAPAPAVDLTAELQKFAALKEQGLIDDAEFSAMKAKLLGI